MKMTEELKNTPTTSPAATLAGKMAGVNVSTPDAMVGANANISIRTASSWNSQSPLYIIDGMMADANQFNDLSSNEIEDITVLKDAASAAIYGSRAAGGVIVVTTKRGNYGSKVKVDYSFNTGFDKRSKELQLTDGVQTAEMYMRVNPTSDPAGWAWSQDEIEWMKTLNGGWGYDILDAVWQDPKITTHNISVSGGSDRVKFFAGGSFTKQDGFMDNMSYKKNSYRLNIAAKVIEGLEVAGQFSLGLQRSKVTTGGGHIGDIRGMYSWLRGWQPDYPIWTESGEPIDIGWWGSIPAQIRGDGGYISAKDLTPTMNISATYQLPWVKGLSVKASYGASYIEARSKSYQKRYSMYKMKKYGKHIWGTKDSDIEGTVMSSQIAKDYLEEASTYAELWQYNLQLNYDRTFNDVHNLKAAFVFEKYNAKYGGMAGGVENFPVYNFDQWWATSPDRVDSYMNRETKYSDTNSGRQSWIGQLFYDYAGKYLLSASYRYDGSMNFAPDERWGFFPSGSVGWVISKEPFFNTKVVDFLKLRASVGLTGNDAVGGWQWQQSYQAGNSAIYGTDNTLSSGITYGVLPNEGLTWEKSLTYNVGVDMSFLEHFNVSAEYYFTNTYDILGTRSLNVPPTFSLQLPAENYGEVHAMGGEIEIGYNNIFGDVNFSASLNASYANANYEKYDDDKVTYDYEKRVGRSLTAVYGYKADRIIRTQEELDQFNAEHPGFNFHGQKPELGQLIYKDLSGPDGTPDGVVNNYDYVMIKKRNNPVLLGLSLGAEWKGLSVNAVFNGSLGVDRMVYDIFDTYEWNRMWVGCYYDSWTPENPNAPLPKKISYYSDRTYVQNTDFWMRKTNFFRLKNLNVAYTLPTQWYQRFGVDRVQVYFTGMNLFLISNFGHNYYDPEMGGASSFPIMKSYNFGLSVTI